MNTSPTNPSDQLNPPVQAAAPPQRKWRLFLTGIGMGSADLVPGVSGGTIAFIFGVYEALIESIKTVSGVTLKLALKRQFRAAWQSVPWGFLLPLGTGLLSALFALASLIQYLLEHQPVYLWSFFFGLVLASIALVGRRVKQWKPLYLVVALVAAVGSYLLVGAVPVQTAATPLAFFGAGFIAICAMILPGVSGSFLLLIMGKYEQILSAVTAHDFLTLGVFAVGAVAGLAVFARVLSWLFHHHHDLTVAVLLGFMLGSLRKVWPWKETLTYHTNHDGVLEPLTTRNMLPPLDLSLLVATLLAVAAAGLILWLDRQQAGKSAD